MYISLWENSRGHPDNISFMQFSTKIDGFEQKDSQGFENSYNSYEQYPLDKFFIFTIYQNYTLALITFQGKACPLNYLSASALPIHHEGHMGIPISIYTTSCPTCTIPRFSQL